MQIKRFFATDTHSALRMVKEAMGPDAVIIANRELEDGVEIIASGDYDESQIESVDAHLQVTGKQTDSAKAAPQQHAIDDMRNEISQLRGLLESQLSTMQVSAWGQQNDARAEIYNQLIGLDIGDDLARRLAASCMTNPGDKSTTGQALTALAQALPVTADTALDEGGIVILHGPTGAGKTTTIAKLAAQYAQLHGSDGIVMISADNRRIGAHEQLLALGKLLAVPVLNARSHQELNALLAALGEKKLVLVDSSGLVQSDLRQPEQLAGMQCDAVTIRHYLVIPAILQSHAMNRVLESMAKLELQGCILSKVDEAAALGNAFTSLIRHQVPIAYWTDGLHIHEHLRPAKANDLVAQAVLIARRKKVQAANQMPLKTGNTAAAAISLRH